MKMYVYSTLEMEEKLSRVFISIRCLSLSLFTEIV